MEEDPMRPLLLLGALIICAGPWLSEPNRAQSTFDPAIAEMISHVADSMMLQTIGGLQSFGTRYSFASTRDTVARWIRGRFLAAGLTDVVLDSFQYSGIGLVNVVATIHGTSASAGEIVVGAHYDSYSPSAYNSAPGADDDASGTSAVMEMARVVTAHGYAPASTIRFIAFSGEEQGLQGSNVYAQRAKSARRPIRAMLNFDQIGYRIAGQGDMDVYLVWYESGEALVALNVDLIQQYTTLTPVLSTRPRTRSDSYAFASKGYAAVWWLEHDGTPYYHTTSDLLEYIDGAYAAEIARSALALVLTLDKSTVDVRPAAETVPTSLRLYQNYPNPFNPTTGIRFQVSGFSDVKLSVFDILGREVAVLVNERMPAGTYQVTFDGSGLASGVYFYRLNARSFLACRAMLLLK